MRCLPRLMYCINEIMKTEPDIDWEVYSYVFGFLQIQLICKNGRKTAWKLDKDALITITEDDFRNVLRKKIASLKEEDIYQERSAFKHDAFDAPVVLKGEDDD